MEGAEFAPGIDEHPGHDQAPDRDLHPWAREMYRRGFNFNGGERNKLFLGTGSELVDVSDFSEANSPLDGRGLVAADFDDDGDVDLFVHNIQRERHHLFRNEVNPGAGGFVSLSLFSEAREPIGATVYVTPEGAGAPTAQVLSRGSGYASCQPNSLVFGLGEAKSARVSVRWPYGAVEDFGVLAGGSRARLMEGSGKAELRPRARCASLADPLPPGLKLALGARVPVLLFEGSDGGRHRLDPEAITKDGPVTIEVWASYCRPCVEKFPELIRRHGEGERIIALSVDMPSERARAERLLLGAGVSFPNFFLVMDDEGNETGFDTMIDLMRLPIPTELTLHPGGILGGVRTGRAER
ncbi:ASPIC and UnbV [Planctomycetes bacterium Poly30]|uniref:ASPIC and UnbV n=1 Tax=Saltatorellus ferox TaxID=2528018 RepID=A0A518EQG0_9BACT|nr:ASPIC and UnbV [Planctomycetes bacterium Poly30]